MSDGIAIAGGYSTKCTPCDGTGRREVVRAEALIYCMVPDDAILEAAKRDVDGTIQPDGDVLFTGEEKAVRDFVRDYFDLEKDDAEDFISVV